VLDDETTVGNAGEEQVMAVSRLPRHGPDLLEPDLRAMALHPGKGTAVADGLLTALYGTVAMAQDM
jgi:hypothetical protein